MFEGADTVVLYDELAYHDVLPVQWRALPRALDRFEILGMDEANGVLLQACIALEEHPTRERNEELGPLAGELARLDSKLNLLLQMMSRLVSQERPPTPSTIQFNALGASWIAMTPLPSVGDAGVLRVQLRSSLPQPLELPAEVSAVTGTTVRVRFPELAQSTVELIQKLAFLRHRRLVAETRKTRGA